MHASHKDITESPPLAPRPHLNSVTHSPSPQLPPLHLVEENVALLKEIQCAGGPARRLIASTAGGAFTTGDSSQGADAQMSEPMRYSILLPHLFKYSFYAREMDVPEAILEGVVFALEMYVRVMTEHPEEPLRVIGYVLPRHETLETTQYRILNEARHKLAMHLLKPSINRPSDAARHLKDQMVADIQKLRKGEKPWVANPHGYNLYARATYLAGQYAETKVVCERLLRDVHTSKSSNLEQTIFMSHMMLSYALLRLGIESGSQKEHTDWTVKFIKKNPTRYPDYFLTQHLVIRDGPTHPVLAALGGESWLARRKQTTLRQDERIMKQCKSCGTTEMLKPLFRCAGCQHVFYCSKVCQKASWEAHKPYCSDVVLLREHVEKLKQQGSPLAQKEADWIEWRRLSHYANTIGLENALGLYRDPSRGRTHLVVRQVKHAPEESDLRYRFTVTHVGVFRLEDCWDIIDDALCLPKGQGKKVMLRDLDEPASAGSPSGQECVPLLDLMLGDDIQPWLRSMTAPLRSLRLRSYEPDWRKFMNKKGVPPPATLLKFKNAVNVEHELN